MANQHDLPHRCIAHPRQLPCLKGIEQRLDLLWTAQEFPWLRWWDLTSEHGGLLVDVTAAVARQQHHSAVGSQMVGPAQKTTWRIPEAVGDHHGRKSRGTRRAHHRHLKTTR